MRLLFCTIVIAVLAGCASPTSKPPDPTKLVKGVTTYDQVISKYGTPRRELRHSRGDRLLQYFTLKRVPGTGGTGWNPDPAGMYARRLDVLISPAGVVKDYSFAENTQPVRRLTDELQTGTPITEVKLRQIHKGTSTRADMVRLFGKPYTEGLHFDGGAAVVWLYARHRPGATEDYLILEAALDQRDRVIDFRTSRTSEFVPWRPGVD
jgi:hypothetical protein